MVTMTNLIGWCKSRYNHLCIRGGVNVVAVSDVLVWWCKVGAQPIMR